MRIALSLVMTNAEILKELFAISFIRLFASNVKVQIQDKDGRIAVLINDSRSGCQGRIGITSESYAGADAVVAEVRKIVIKNAKATNARKRYISG